MKNTKLVSRNEAISKVEKYLELPLNQIQDKKIPIYKSLRKRLFKRGVKLYGKLRNRHYFEESIIEPDDWRIIEDRLVILDDGVYEDENCWVISYNSEIYNETENLMDLRLGIGPIIIDKITGYLYPTGGGDDNILEDYIKFVKGNPSKINWENRKIEL